MRLATWNVNSIRARESHVEAWLTERLPSVDVVCLQELKVQDEQFPMELVERLGFHAAVFGQKTYNGVAILSRAPIDNVTRGMGNNDPLPEHSRLIGGDINGVRVFSAYFPNGSQVGSDKYEQKLAWMKQLRAYLDARYDASEPLVLCGDFNVAPFDNDMSQPDDWRDTVLANDEVRSALEHIAEFGLHDVVRPFFPNGGLLSWWDYRARGLERNNGLRIDHVYATQPMLNRAIGAVCDKAERRKDSPSDHAPVVVEFAATL